MFINFITIGWKKRKSVFEDANLFEDLDLTPKNTFQNVEKILKYIPKKVMKYWILHLDLSNTMSTYFIPRILKHVIVLIFKRCDKKCKKKNREKGKFYCGDF